MAGLCEGRNERPVPLNKLDQSFKEFQSHNGRQVDVAWEMKVPLDLELKGAACGACRLSTSGNEFQSLGRAIVKEDEYEEVRWDGIVSIVSWRERVFRLWWEERHEWAGILTCTSITKHDRLPARTIRIPGILTRRRRVDDSELN
ncbi:hypothetical protein ANN_15577 [Periplaneta americana]|uniref:Uncharacterized protein n=1 Tax=Periplaneta americana TaxID=6978 RepID=A0ABQ8SGR2_PERAM|nr:hypothetical protein ANN_15577 [Periplaneta americana]